MAQNKVINTILNLKDNMSKGLVKVSTNTKGMSKELQKASRQASLMASNFGKSVEKMTTKAIKLTGTMTGLAGAFALKTGISEGLDMEGYRVQLDTAVKDTQKATELMKNAVSFANKTPFETGSVVEATAKMEMYGLSSTRWLSDIADMAGATNKSIDQATEAMADVAVGEFERLKEFGIKKDMIVAEAQKAYGDGVVFNNLGQVTDQEKLLDTVQKMMQEKYKGGAEKLSQTVKGMWSTITGITKNSLATIVGIGDDGLIKAGSLLDTIKTKMKLVGDTLLQLQENGTMQKVADKMSQVFNMIVDGVSKVISFIVKYKHVFGTIGAMAVGFTLTMKAVRILIPVLNTLKLVWALLNGAIALTPIGWVIIGITALAGALYLLWVKSETFRNAVMQLGSYLGTVFTQMFQTVNNVWNNQIMPSLVKLQEMFMILWQYVLQPLAEFIGAIFVSQFVQAFETLKALFETVVTFIGEQLQALTLALSGIIDFITGVFTGNWSMAWEGVKNIFVGIFNGILSFCKSILNGVIDIINGAISGINKFTSIDLPIVGQIGFTIPSIPKFATGTQYFRGGLAQINEHGGEMVDLPNGSKVIPADKTDKLLNGKSAPIINITVQGNVIGNHEFIDEMGSVITSQLKLALAN